MINSSLKAHASWSKKGVKMRVGISNFCGFLRIFSKSERLFSSFGRFLTDMAVKKQSAKNESQIKLLGFGRKIRYKGCDNSLKMVP